MSCPITKSNGEAYLNLQLISKNKNKNAQQV